MSNHKAISRAKKGKRIRQVGVLPYRYTPEGGVEFLLITSRATNRFVIPKGWQIKGKTDPQSAGKEAEQEAGIVGRAQTSPIGEYQYWKRLRTSFVPVTVRVFAMRVEGELPQWRERKERKRAWLTPEQAAMLVEEPALSALLLRAPRDIEAASPGAASAKATVAGPTAALRPA